MRCLLLISFLLLVSCGGSSPEPGGKKPAPAGKLKVLEVSTADGGETGTGRITGRAWLDGEAPKPRRLDEVRHNAGCLEMGHEPPSDNRRLVGPDGGIANVVVRLQRAPSAPPPPDSPLELDQVGCVFVPRVTAIQAGRPLLVRNSDGIVHNARLTAQRNSTFNINLGPKGKPVAVQLDSAEICQVRCDIHPWMSAQVVVVDHPWFAVSDSEGRFEIAGIPPGVYGLDAWHETYGRLRLREITVAESGKIEVLATFRP